MADGRGPHCSGHSSPGGGRGQSGRDGPSRKRPSPCERMHCAQHIPRPVDIEVEV